MATLRKFKLKTKTNQVQRYQLETPGSVEGNVFLEEIGWAFTDWDKRGCGKEAAVIIVWSLERKILLEIP